jgi:aryl-alcohol dehydrogenase-like predicted oxidoreductase
MDFKTQTSLGRTGLKVGRLGIASSYGAPAQAYEEAFERGCNYFTVGTFLRGRSKEMIRAICNITAKGKREELVLSLYDYTHSPVLGQSHFRRGLKTMGLEYADVLLLGFYPRKPRKGIMKWALELKEQGLVRHLALSSHQRTVFPRLVNEGEFDLFHLRYNPVHRGAEKDVFPLLPAENKPGIVSYTATRWGQLLKENKMPPGEKPLSANECYRFVLQNPSVDVVMTGARSLEMMRENLQTLEMPALSPEQMERIRKIGDHLYCKPGS